jgi:hypothetical protein
METTKPTESAVPTGKPVITQFQHDWEVHHAGLAAMEAAKAQGMDPNTATALLDGATGLTVEGVRFPALGAGLVLALPQLGLLSAKSSLLQDAACQMAAMALALHDTPKFWRLVRGGKVEDLEEAVFDFMSRFTLTGLNKITTWINAEYARLQGEAAEKEVGKPEMASPAETLSGS